LQVAILANLLNNQCAATKCKLYCIFFYKLVQLNLTLQQHTTNDDNLLSNKTDIIHYLEYHSLLRYQRQ